MRIAIQILTVESIVKDDIDIVEAFENSTLLEVVGDVVAQFDGEVDRLSISVHRP